MGATRKLAQWITGVDPYAIPLPAIRAAEQSCFDTIGVALAGAAQPVGQTIAKFVERQGGTPEATVLATGFRTSAANAALANGTMAHAMDYDDMGGIGHPSAVILPALLAIGETIGSSGRDILSSYVVGFEVGLVLTGGGLGRGFEQAARGFHTTSAFGRMAATAATSKLLKLTEDQTVMALGIASSMASGLIHSFGTMTKPLHAGMAARDGIIATQLAKDGFTAGDQCLEHPGGFVSAFHREAAKADDLVGSLGENYHAQDALFIKKYPCCGANHPLLDSLLAIIAENNLRYEDILEVVIGDVYHLSVALLYDEPKTGLEGKFSLAYNAAIAILDGKVDIDSFTDERARDPKVKEALGKVRTIIKPVWAPTSKHQPLPITVRTVDGRTLARAIAFPDMLGGVRYPWGIENVRAKFEANAKLVLPDSKVRQAIATWSDLQQIRDIREALSSVVSI